MISSPSDPFSLYYAEILRAEGLNALHGRARCAPSRRADAGEPPGRGAGADAAERRAGVDAHQLGAGRRQPDRDAAGQEARRPARADRRRHDAARGLPARRHGASPGDGHHRPDDAVPRHGRPLHARTAPARWRRCTRTPRRRRPTPPSRCARSAPRAGRRRPSRTTSRARSSTRARATRPGAARSATASTPIRSDDLFFGALAGDAAPDWVDLDKVAIPQADEQQRLLANMVTEMNLDRAPLPRFWYLPRGEKAAVVMTGDDHGHERDRRPVRPLQADSPPGCSVADWECIRGTSYMYTRAPLTDDSAARAYEADGLRDRPPPQHGLRQLHASFELDTFFDEQLADFATAWPSLSRAQDEPHALHRVQRLGEHAEVRARARHPARHELLLLARAAGCRTGRACSPAPGCRCASPTSTGR